MTHQFSRVTINHGGIMIIKDTTFGEVELEFYVDSFSAVDSFAQSGYSLTLDRELTDSELESFAEIAQDYAYSHGSLNHN